SPISPSENFSNLHIPPLAPLDHWFALALANLSVHSNGPLRFLVSVRNRRVPPVPMVHGLGWSAVFAAEASVPSAAFGKREEVMSHLRKIVASACTAVALSAGAANAQVVALGEAYNVVFFGEGSGSFTFGSPWANTVVAFDGVAEVAAGQPAGIF